MARALAEGVGCTIALVLVVGLPFAISTSKPEPYTVTDLEEEIETSKDRVLRLSLSYSLTTCSHVATEQCTRADLSLD